MITPAECRKRRMALQWSQVELAERVGVSGATISAYERGDTSMRAATRTKLEQVFKDAEAGSYELPNAPANEDVDLCPEVKSLFVKMLGDLEDMGPDERARIIRGLAGYYCVDLSDF